MTEKTESELITWMQEIASRNEPLYYAAKVLRSHRVQEEIGVRVLSKVYNCNPPVSSRAWEECWSF